MVVEFADPEWDGNRIPKGQQCKKFGGNGSTPALRVSNTPVGANAIVIKFNDLSYGPMTNGGRGTVGWKIGDVSETVLLSVPGGTNELPEGTWLERRNRATGAWTSPGYLPPCSGGNLNKYVATVIAVQMDGGDVAEQLAETDITMGKY